MVYRRLQEVSKEHSEYTHMLTHAHTNTHIRERSCTQSSNASITSWIDVYGTRALTIDFILLGNPCTLQRTRFCTEFVQTEKFTFLTLCCPFQPRRSVVVQQTTYE